MTKKQTKIITLMILAVIFLGFLVSGRLWFLLDLTGNKAHTIAEVSRNLHREIQNTVKITYYISDSLRAADVLPDEIIDLLRMYVSYSRGKIHLSIIDPIKERVDHQIEQLGIVPHRIPSLEQDKFSISIVYSGITIEYLDKTMVIPSVASLETLEYDITSRIRSMISNSTRTLGVIIGEFGLDWNVNFMFMQGIFMQAGYQIRLIHYGEEIPENINALFVIGGVEAFDETILKNIDRYIHKGGKALFAVKGVHVDLEQWRAGAMENNGLLDMLSYYGVDVLPQLVMEYSNMVVPNHEPSQSGGFMLYPFLLRVAPSNINQNHPVSSRLSELYLYWANPLEINLPEDSGIEAAELFSTGDEAWLMASPYYVSPELDFTYARDRARTQGKRTLGVSLSGIFPRFFEEDLFEYNSIENTEQEGKPANIIVIGDSFFTSEHLFMLNKDLRDEDFHNWIVTQTIMNMSFLIKTADWLGDDDDIMGIRVRAASNKLDKLAFQPEKEAAAISFIHTLNVYIVPLLVVFAGMFFILWRRSKIKVQDQEISENETGEENDI